ncbi:MAG: hypothetical protein RIA71_13960 [Oceanicaulis sp.]
MDHVSIGAAAALSGEEAFILQLRPPAPPGADEAALADHVDRFTLLYLTGAGPERARFARLAPLTWAIAASRFDAEQVEAVRADLNETLFGADHPERAQLARQPAEPQADNLAGQPSAAARAAFDDDSDTFDIDSAVLDLDDSDVFEVDSWRPAQRRIALDSAVDADMSTAEDLSADPGDDESADFSEDHALDESSHHDSGHESDLAEILAENAQDDAGSDMSRDDDRLGLDEDGSSGLKARVEDDVLGALAELERAFASDIAGQDDEPEPRDEKEAAPASLSLEDEPDWDADAHDVFDSYAGPPPSEVPFDARRFDADLDAFEAAALEADGDNLDDDPFGDADDLWEPAASAAAAESDRFESLTEAPAPRSGDLAAELAAFRREMRAIAGAIPGAGSGDALDHFRSELDAIAGSMGQRIDGAAQRIEAAADRIVSAAGPETADRFDGAAERAERSAALLETSVQDAVRALKAVLDAAGGSEREALAGA